jgi:hypothetical protein
MEVRDALVLDAWYESDLHLAPGQLLRAMRGHRYKNVILAFERTVKERPPQRSGIQVIRERYTNFQVCSLFLNSQNANTLCETFSVKDYREALSKLE